MSERPITVAVIDDHPQVRQSTKEYMDMFGFEVLFDAHNGSDFLQKIEKALVLPDVCLMDLNMPVMDGFEAIRKIRIKNINIGVVAFSIDDSPLQIRKAFDAGADDFISKNSSPQELRKIIEEVYNKK